MMLTSCVSSGPTTVSLKVPAIPSDLRSCFDYIVPAPKGPLTRGQVMKLISSLKLSETEKVRCGKRLIHFYKDFT